MPDLVTGAPTCSSGAPDFYLSVDEFQNFATESFTSILAEARKYRLNTKLRIKGHYLVSQGALNEAMAQPREVFRIAIMAAAYAIVLMHNHPSGETDPSNADRAITRRISQAAEIIRIELCDHVIVGHQRYFSFKETGLLK